MTWGLTPMLWFTHRPWHPFQHARAGTQDALSWSAMDQATAPLTNQIVSSASSQMNVEEAAISVAMVAIGTRPEFVS